jgi:hypothetical protein
MIKYFLKKTKDKKNFEVDWSLEPTICILCGKKEKCDCSCIKLNCDNCNKVAIDCICLEEKCKKCENYILDCVCKKEVINDNS